MLRALGTLFPEGLDLRFALTPALGVTGLPGRQNEDKLDLLLPSSLPYTSPLFVALTIPAGPLQPEMAYLLEGLDGSFYKPPISNGT